MMVSSCISYIFFLKKYSSNDSNKVGGDWINK